MLEEQIRTLKQLHNCTPHAENINKNMAYLIKRQIKLLEMKTMLSKMKITLDKTSGLEDIAAQTTQNGTQWSYGITSSGQRRGERGKQKEYLRK